jgi:hypothetical protein
MSTRPNPIHISTCEMRRSSSAASAATSASALSDNDAMQQRVGHRRRWLRPHSRRRPPSPEPEIQLPQPTAGRAKGCQVLDQGTRIERSRVTLARLAHLLLQLLMLLQQRRVAAEGAEGGGSWGKAKQEHYESASPQSCLALAHGAKVKVGSMRCSRRCRR